MPVSLGWNRHSSVLAVLVLTALLEATVAQSYYLSINQNQRNYFSGEDYKEVKKNSTTQSVATPPHFNEVNEENSTSFVVKNTVRKPSELSQTAMDIITIVWYVATFLALAAFFLLMTCSDRRCNDTQQNGANSLNETPVAPPTPSPSYSEFAPPSYESVMKMQSDSKLSIFVLPYPSEGSNGHIKDANHTTSSRGDEQTTTIPTTPTTPTTPAISLYSVNELQKFAS